MRSRIAVSLCALTGACAAPEPAATSAPAQQVTASGAPTSAPASPASRSYAEELVAYLARLRTLNESALGAEAARMKRDSSDLARVKAALALSLAAHSDEGDILELVDPTVRKPSADRDVRAMAAFLQALAIERRRLKQTAAAASGQLREERRAVESQKQRAEALQQKLDALTELEKSLATREGAPR